MFSIDHYLENCGEACIDEKDFWKLKIFETGLKKAERDHPCKGFGYTDYKSTDTHGLEVHSLTLTLDLYDKPEEHRDVDTEYDDDIELDHLDEIEELTYDELIEIDNAA